MADKQKTSLKRLAKKLSALRATLSKDERVLLDQIVLGAQEVKPHVMTSGAANPGKPKAASGGANEVMAHRMIKSKAATGAANEVMAHAMTSRAANPGKPKAATGGANEVMAHAMTPGTANQAASTGAANQAASTGAASASSTGAASLLQFDAMTGGYAPAEAGTI